MTPYEAFDRLWKECTGAIQEARVMEANGESPAKIAETLRFAREMIDAVKDEMALYGMTEPIEGLPPLADLQAAILSMERAALVRATQH